MRIICLCIAAIFAISGCANSNSTSQVEPKPETHTQTTGITNTDLEQFVQSSDRHVLIEFCENIENSSQHSFAELSQKYANSVQTITVDFTEHVELVSKYGGTTCPTYLLFEKGDACPSFAKSFPISQSELETEILAVLVLAAE